MPPFLIAAAEAFFCVRQTMVCSETKILPGGVWNLDNTSKAQCNQEHNLGLQLRSTSLLETSGQKLGESR